MANNTTLNTGAGGDVIRDIDKGGVKTQVVALDAGGSGTESLVTLSNPLPIQPAATSFIFSAAGVNTTTTQLASGATFTGTIESIQSQQAISVLLVCDQPGTLVLREYIDAAGTQVTNTIVEKITAGNPFSEAYTANGNYFSLTFTNTGGYTTTALSINTAYGTLPAVTTLGNSQVSLNEINGVGFNIGQQQMAASIPVTIAGNQTAVTVDEMASSEGEYQEDLLRAILRELRMLNYLIASEFRVRDDLDFMRNDPSLDTRVN